MRSITAMLHTCNSGLILGRALETLHAVDAILIVDHNSQDATVRIAREYGARVFPVVGGTAPGHYSQLALTEWIFCLEPQESMTEHLAASLYEWKSLDEYGREPALNVLLRDETPQGWIDLPEPETRLVPKNWKHWQDRLPAHDPAARTLEGPLLRFKR
jgi:glycosyltransferase involved in cell wall biosynthesis